MKVEPILTAFPPVYTAQPIHDLTYLLKESDEDESQDTNISETKTSQHVHDLTYLLKESDEEGSRDTNISETKKSQHVHDLTYLLKESDEEDSRDTNIPETKKSQHVHDLTYLLKESDEEDSQDTNISETKKTQHGHDLTYLLKESDEEDSQDTNIPETNKCSANETVTMVDHAPHLIQQYMAEIPTETKAYRLFPGKIRADIMNNCPCKIQCSENLLKDDNIIPKIQHLRSKYYRQKQGNERTNKMVDFIQNTVCTGFQRTKRCHIFQGHMICCHKFCDLLSLSPSTYYRALFYVKNDVMEVESFRKNPSHNERGLSVVGFIENFLKDYGDNSPEREIILMPDCINIKYIFDEYMEGQGPYITERHFYRLFSENFGKKVSFAKTKNINPCDICMKVKMDLFKLRDPLIRQLLKRDLKEHLDRQREERQEYYRKREEATKKPNEAFSIILDGAPALKTHITGAVVHGKKDNFFIDLLQWPHGPDLTLSCLVKAICDGRTCLPPKLYVQCDNCGRENKNRYVIGFLGYLCLAGYVQEAHLSFLIKGHTHEDIDQRFSKISHRLRRHSAMTLPKLKAEVEKSFIVNHNVEVLGCVWDIKTWLDDVLNDISNHSYQHQFWLYCDRPKHMVLRYRRFSTDNWKPDTEDNQLELFSLDTSGDHKFPTGIPKYVTPIYEETRMDYVRSSIQKMKNFLSFEENKWWEEFLKNPSKTVRRNIRWPIASLRKVHQPGGTPEQPLTGNSSVTVMIETEQTSREVMIRRKRRRSD